MFITYGFPTVDNSSDGTAAAKLYFKLTTKVRRSVAAYGVFSMCAEFGGYMGLLLGFSLLDLAGLAQVLVAWSTGKDWVKTREKQALRIWRKRKSPLHSTTSAQ